ncbi:hypothetical protein L486_05580 [Kwoniella mangroviensis CBS 10435]|uniref:Uncharacterized protein n=1 Tax=Kwoniella mangroviensis CBS 10435 TaxID=1331196 RepID=A0A1B9IM92_9TREE|nr:hypothetical protein L486_05580 [Kwoniella mangroviensis CBS 10435]
MVAQLSTEQQKRLDDGETLLREYQSSKKLHTLNGVQFHEIIVSQVAKFVCGRRAGLQKDLAPTYRQWMIDARAVAEMVCHKLTRLATDELQIHQSGANPSIDLSVSPIADAKEHVFVLRHKTKRLVISPRVKKDLLDLGITRFLKYYYCHSIDVNSWICIENHKALTRKKEQMENELILASAMNKKLHM